MPLFRGLSAFPLTPTDEGGDLRAATFTRMLEGIVEAGIDSIGLLGSTGGYAYLTLEQRRHAVRVAVKHVGGRIPVMVGVGALRTDAAVALARDAREAGADALLLAPVSYTALTDEEVFQHFATVAEAGQLPLSIYNNPGTTHFRFSPELIARLARLPHVAAVKMPLPDGGDVAGELGRLRAITPEDFRIGYSGDWGAGGALLAGADAWYSVVAGLLPTPALALTRATQAGDRALVERLEAEFQPLWTLFKRFGSFRVMYALADVLGFGALSPPRPVLPLPSDVREEVAGAIATLKRHSG